MAQHAILSASGAYRWLKCTPSARLERQFKDEQSPYAAEGTRAHAAAEQLLTKELFPDKKVTEPKFDDKEMEIAVKRYVDICMEKVIAARKRTPDADIQVEARVDFSRWVPEGFGTGDMVIVADDTLEIVDLKYGKGVPVSAEGNPQMRLYALGAYEANSLLYDIKTIRMTIVQPRLDSVNSDEMSIEELIAWGDSIKDTAKLAYDGEGECQAGDHCGFCKARHLCRALSNACLDEFYKHGGKKTSLLLDTEVAEVLDMADMIIKWAKDVQNYAFDQAVNEGKNWPGYKLVEGRSSRKITNAEAAAQALLDADFTAEDIYKPQELRGITDLTKLVGKKKLTDTIGQFIDKPPGKPTLVPLSDKRAPLELNPVNVDDFDDLLVD